MYKRHWRRWSLDGVILFFSTHFHNTVLMAQAWSVIITYLLMVLAASTEGICHAILWSGKKSGAFKWNEHIVFVAQRAIFGIAILYTGNILALGAGVLAYPFFHNGFYYSYRNKIDGSYTQGFNADSLTSSAVINFSYRLRTTLFVISLLLLFVLIVK